MSDQPAPETTRNPFSLIIWLGPYSIAVSTLYLWGYWGSFHINVLEYIGIADIVKTAVYPITSAFAFFAIGAVFWEVFAPTRHLPPGGGANTAIAKGLRKVAPLVTTSFFIAITIYFLVGPVEKWRILPILFAMAVYLPIKSTRLLLEEFKSDGVRSIAVFLLAALPPFAYGRGVLEASELLTGKNYNYAVSEMPGHTAATGAKIEEHLRYVGRANDRYVFFYPVDQAISFTAVSEVKALALKRHGDGDAVPKTTPARESISTEVPKSTNIPASKATKGTN